MLVLFVSQALAQTNVIVLPGVTPTGQIDITNLMNLLILGLTPVVIQGIKWLIPKVPDVVLNLLAPLAGVGIALLLNACGVGLSTGWGAAIWGGCGTWLYELTANSNAHLQAARAVTTTPPA